MKKVATVNVKEFKDALLNASRFVADDYTRDALKCTWIVVDGESIIVNATNAYMLYNHSVPGTAFVDETVIIMPSKDMINDLPRKGDVTLKLDKDNRLVIYQGKTRVALWDTYEYRMPGVKSLWAQTAPEYWKLWTPLIDLSQLKPSLPRKSGYAIAVNNHPVSGNLDFCTYEMRESWNKTPRERLFHTTDIPAHIADGKDNYYLVRAHYFKQAVMIANDKPVQFAIGHADNYFKYLFVSGQNWRILIGVAQQDYNPFAQDEQETENA